MVRDTTKQNLKNAFSGESQAHVRYIIFSDIAEHQGYNNVARLFKAIAYAERIHSTNHFKNLAYLKGGHLTVSMAGFGLGDTLQNLSTAIEGETYEINEMYPAYLEIAQSQGEEGATKSFGWAYEAEKTHARFFKKAKEAVTKKNDLNLDQMQICSICGYTVEGNAPEECPICMAKKKKFKKY
jgi:rubrerythrin